MHKAATYHLTLPPALLEEGYWLYVWRIKTPEGEELLYVGRTGDSSSPHHASPIRRLSQHLGNNEKNNSLQKNLSNYFEKNDLTKFELVEAQQIDFIAHGPVFTKLNHVDAATLEEKMKLHTTPRNGVAALEKKLCDALSVHYKVLNQVHSKQELDLVAWENVKQAFTEHFKKLRTPALL